MSNLTVQPLNAVNKPPQVKANKQSGDNGFNDMLSGAIQKGDKTGSQKPAEKTGQTTGTDKAPESNKNDTKTSKTQQQENTQGKEAVKTDNADKATEAHAENISQNADELEALAAAEAATQAAGMQAELLHGLVPQIAAQPSTEQVSAGAEAVVESVKAEGTKTAEVPATHTAGTQPAATNKTAETQPQGAVTETKAPTTEAVQDTDAETVQVTVEDNRQAKFDEMLAKAAQELGQGKTAQVAEAKPQDTAAETKPLDTAAKTLTGEDAAQDIETTDKADVQKTDITTENDKPVNTKANAEQNRATVLKAEDTTTNKPVKHATETDEATLGLIQPKAPEILYSEPVRETKTVSQPHRMPDQTEQIRTQVIQNLENDKMEFRMQLQPQELGKIDIKMVLEGGKLAVEIAAASQQSTDILTKQTEALMSSLRLNNIEVSSVSVVTANENASGSMNSQYNLNNFQNQQGQGSNGTNHKTNNGTANDNGSADTLETDSDTEAPQRMLNYSV